MKLVSRKKFLLTGLSLISLPSFLFANERNLPKIVFLYTGLPGLEF